MRRLAEALTGRQVRALQGEEPWKQLTAGEGAAADESAGTNEAERVNVGHGVPLPCWRYWRERWGMSRRLGWVLYRLGCHDWGVGELVSGRWVAVCRRCGDRRATPANVDGGDTPTWRSAVERREQVSVGAGVIAAVLAGLIGWFLTESAGAAIVIALLIGTSVWLWFRRLS